MRTNISRRSLLKNTSIGAVGLLLAACQPKVVETVIRETVIVEKPIEKIVKETVIVEGTPQVVEKVVVAEVPTAAPKAAVNLVVSWWGPPAQTQAYEFSIKDYGEKNPHVTFEIVSPGGAGEYLTKLMTMIGAGETVDIMLMENSNVMSGRFVPFASQKALLDLTERAAVAGIRKEDFVPNAWEQSSYNGVLYGMPYNTQCYQWIYNVDMYADAERPNPTESHEAGEWTYERFLEDSIAMAKPEERLWGLQARTSIIENFVWEFGGRLVSEDGKTAMLLEPATIAGFDAYYDLLHKYNVMPSTAVQSSIGSMWDAGYTVHNQSGNWDLLQREQKAMFKWNIVPMPSGPAGRFSMGWTGQWGIGVTSKNPEDAFDAIAEFAGAEGQKLATIMKMGRAPARQAIVDNYYYSTWQNWDVKYYIEAFTNNCVRTGSLGGPPGEALAAAQQLIDAGNLTVQQALEEAQPKVQAALDRGDTPVQLDLLKYSPSGC